MRTRLREVSQLLGISLPVYILFTRADRLQFFQDYVRNLTEDEATVVFGATLPMVSYSSGVYAEQETARVSGAFDNLFQSLAERRLPYLYRRNLTPRNCPPSMSFPGSSENCDSLLVRLLVDICRPSQLRTGPFLRGFYFTGVRPVVITTPGPALVQEEPSAQPSAGRRYGRHRNLRYRKGEAPAAQQAHRLRRRGNPPSSPVGFPAPCFQ